MDMKGIIQNISAMAWFIVIWLFIVVFCLSVNASDQVDTDIELEFIDGTHLEIDAIIDVTLVTLPANGVTYTQSEIQSLSSNNPEMMGAIKISIKGLTLDQLKASFPDAQIISLQELPTYSSGVFTDSYRLHFLPSFFSLNESLDIDSFINGFLDCGAHVNYTFSLISYTGWNQSYVFSLPPSIGYRRTNGNVQQNQITWMVRTSGEPAEKSAQLTLLDADPTTPYTENETITVQFIMDCTQASQPFLITQFKGFSIITDSYDMIPGFISQVKSLPADAIRLTILSNLTSWNTVKNLTFDPSFQQVKPFLENSSMNQTITSVFTWRNDTTLSPSAPYNVSKMDTIPPITANYTDTHVSFTICNLSSRAVFGMINAGGDLTITPKDVNIGDNLEGIPFSYNGSIHFPNHVFLDDANPFHWDQENPIQGIFSSTNAADYSDYDISSVFEITVKSTDLNLLSFFTGRTESTMGLYLKETQKRNVTEIPFHFLLPEKIGLNYLNSDGFRVCVEENVFTDQQIDQFTIYEKTIFQNRAKSLFPLIKGKATFDRTLYEESLQWDQNISMMDGTSPIMLSSSMHTAFPLPFDFSVIPPQVNMQTLNLSFIGVNNQDITYLMVFPKGISIEATDTLDRVNIKQDSNGNMLLSLSFNASEGGKIDTVLVTMRPSGLYILGMFVPCIISVFITIVLFVLVFILRKKRKTMPPSQRDGPPTNYQDEDYYVPPPPGSK